jgi:exodeoxyribonuclease VII small subunit
MNFEETMKKLEIITQELEKGDLNLEDSVKKFEEGMDLSKKAGKILEESENKINILIQKDDEVIEESFEGE